MVVISWYLVIFLDLKKGLNLLIFPCSFYYFKLLLLCFEAVDYPGKISGCPPPAPSRSTVLKIVTHYKREETAV